MKSNCKIVFNKIWENALDCIFPKECYDCGKEGEYLCPSCFDNIQLIENFPCFFCNEPGHDRGVCSVCSAKTQIDRAIVAATYLNNLTGKLVEEFKYNFVEDLKNILVKILQRQIDRRQLAGVFWNHVLLPIPLHKKRLAERGFNQSAELAKGLRIKYNCTVDESLLKRAKNTSQQAKLNREQRLDNLQNAFVFNLKKQPPERVILLDDVLTTGATFCEAARVLKERGVKEVICLAICHG